MKESRQLAAAIDLRARQLAAQGVNDSALLGQMVGYMAGLQRLWQSISADELDALCQEYPRFVRYATLMEDLSERLRTGIGVPEHIYELAPLPPAIKHAMARVLGQGAELERALKQRLDQSGHRRAELKVTETPDFEALHRRWSAAIRSFAAEVHAIALAEPAQTLLLQSLRVMAARIERLHQTAASSEEARSEKEGSGPLVLRL